MINTVMQGLGDEPSAIRELFSYGLVRKSEIGEENVFDFSIGNPSVPVPEAVTRAIAEAATLPPMEVHSYTPASGAPSTCQVVADSLNRRFNANAEGKDIYLTCGAAAAISISLKAVIEEGDEIIVFAPFFPEYRVWIETHGAKLVQVNANESDFQIDPAVLEAAITPRTKAVIVNSPNNPVGVVYTPETLQGIAGVLERKSAELGRPIFIISDEPYRELFYGDAQVSWVPHIYANTIVCYSWSKAFSLPGERIGYVYVPKTVTEQPRVRAAVAGAGRALGFICAPAMFQLVLERCIDEPVNKQAYEENGALLAEILGGIGYTYIKPQGAFYLWVKALEDDAQAFSDRAKAHELLLVPSDSFGVGGWVRLGYCVSQDVIKGSAQAFQDLYDEYR